MDGQRVDLEGRELLFMNFRHMPTHRGTPPELDIVCVDVRASKLVLAMSRSDAKVLSGGLVAVLEAVL